MTMIRLINTTTRLRIDKSLEESFFRIIEPRFMSAVVEQSRESYVDVQFVSRDDPHLAPPPNEDVQDAPIPDMDILGVYIPHDPHLHCSLIKVCPERVRNACHLLRHKIADPLPFAVLYPTLLNAVIIHELAHSLMDDKLYGDKCFALSWEQHVGRLDENRRRANENLVVDENDEFADSPPVSDTDMEKRIQHQRKADDYHCARMAGHTPEPVRQYREKVEESLANAFVLQQQFTASPLRDLRRFIELQPPAYRAGLKWGGDIGQLLTTASSWRSFKRDFIGIGGKQWDHTAPGQRLALEDLVRRLGAEEQPIGWFDFQNGT
jgi:hypothetical protein